MSKRKRIVLTMKDKYEINKRLEEGESATKLSNEYNIGRSTITDIKKQKTTINNFISQLDSSSGSTSRKTMKLASNIALDEAVYKWLIQKRSQGESISGPILCEKAIEFNEKLGSLSNFQASTGWLKRFMTRHGIHNLQMQGEKLSADSFETKLKDLKEENDPLEDVYNTDEADEENPASGREFPKTNEDRISTVACANATDSHRLPMLVIGKNKKRCLRHVKIPIVYAYDAAGYKILQDKKCLDLILLTNKTEATDSTSSTASSDNEDENIIDASEAFTCLDIALRWFETQAESDQYQISVLKEIRDLAARKRGRLLRQTKIEDYFKR